MIDFFKNLDDNDFLSNKLTHIYFKGTVNNNSVEELIENVKKANNDIEINGIITKPKPILIHINSQGGSVYDGMRFLSIFKISIVPIATIIDNYSFSAATFLSIHSPYRVMTKNSFCLLHYYSFTGNISVKRDKLLNNMLEFETYFTKITDMYLKKTKFNKEELNELLQHDLYLDYKYCLEKGIVDRVIDFDSQSHIITRKVFDILRDKKTININLLPCSNDNKTLDSIIMKNNENSSNIYVIYPINTTCNDDTINKTYIVPKEEKINNEKYSGEFDYFHTLNLINRIKVINGIKISIIDVPISIDNILPLLYTNKIYIYNHSFIICNMLYIKHPINNILIEDIFKNYKTLFNRIKTILKQKTKMSLTNISDINKKYIIITPKEAVKLGLCNEIIYS